MTNDVSAAMVTIEVATLLRLSMAQVFGLVTRRELVPYLVAPGVYRFSRTEVLAYLDGCEARRQATNDLRRTPL